jgi:hypothetical protein
MGKATNTRAGHGPGAGHGDDGLCGAKTRSGGTCGRQAGWGTSHLGVGSCSSHGGSTPTHELSGAVALARRQALVMGEPLDADPHEVILDCIRIARGEVRYCSDRIADLEDALVRHQAIKVRPLSYGKEGESATETVEEVTTSEQVTLHAWVVARHAAMDRAVNYSKIALAAGVEERRVRVAERAGEMMAQLIRGVLTDLGVPLEDPKTREVVVRHLRLVEGGGQAA